MEQNLPLDMKSTAYQDGYAAFGDGPATPYRHAGVQSYREWWAGYDQAEEDQMQEIINRG